MYWNIALLAALTASCSNHITPVVLKPAERPDTAVTPATDTLHPTRVDSGTPAPPGQYRFVPASQIAIWQTMRASNALLWQEAVSVCALTGTSGERYGDRGVWCAIIAVTTNDSASAAKVIAKLRAIDPAADPNTIRQDYILRVTELDLLRKWLTPADMAVIAPVLDTWASHISGLRPGDSDAFVGEGCGATLWDLYNGRTPNYPVMTSELTRYMVLAHGGEWIESSEYNGNTVTLLAECNRAVRMATGQDIVPGTSAILAAAGYLGAVEITPDLQQTMQWGDDQYPRDIMSRLFRWENFWLATYNPASQWIVQQENATHWPFVGNQLMEDGLLMTDPTIVAAPLPAKVTLVADGMGMLYRRDGATLEWAAAMNHAGVDHSDQAPPFGVQVYRNGWLLTNPIAYPAMMSTELMGNAPVYAGLNFFPNRHMTWADSGNGWAAIAGVTSGRYWAVNNGAPPPVFLRYGGRVIVVATVANQPVVIVRDSTDMDDPRTLPDWPTGYLQTAEYQHQSRINDFDGEMWALWHMPVQPNVNGATLTWTAANGTSVSLQAFADQPVTVNIVDENTVFGSDVTAAEKHWQARLHADAPVLFEVFAAGSPTVTRAGNTITVGGASWTITSAGVRGP